LLSSICRQFLVGLARLAGGSSRESVSTLVETSPDPQRASARRRPRAAVAAPGPSGQTPNPWDVTFRRRATSTSRRTLKSLPLF